MYEDLDQIARLRLNKEVERISRQTLERVREIQGECAVRAGSSGVRSGQQEASIAREKIDGAEAMVRAFFGIWVDLIKQRKGHISRPDVTFITGKVDGYANTQKGHLHRSFSQQRMGAVSNLLTEEAGRRMYAVAADVRRDLEIMAQEYEAFPNVAINEKERGMQRQPKRRFSPGRRVLVGHQSRPGKIVTVDERPGDMGEFRHIVAMDHDGQQKPVLGCDLQAFPGLDEDLTHGYPPTPVASSVFQGDQIINYGPVGAVGRNAQGVINTHEQRTDNRQLVDLQVLAAQLEQLRAEYRKTATSREDDKQLALLGEAADAAEKGDDKGVASILAQAGKGILEMAKEIGTDVVAKVIAELAKTS
jgi:hypothetical protein